MQNEICQSELEKDRLLLRTLVSVCIVLMILNFVP